MSLIKLDDVKRSYRQINAVNGISFELAEDSQYVIQGASGSGKSTLLYLMGGLERPSGGSIWVNGKNLATLSDEELAEYRNRFVGFIFQFHFLLPSMDCMGNILLPARIGNVVSNELKKEILSLAEILGVSNCLKKYPFELSGGEQQRINIIRALSLKPKLLLCDEPTGNLDSVNSVIVTELLGELARKYKSTLVIVTHDKAVASKFTNQLLLQDGLLIESIRRTAHDQIFSS